MCDNCHNCKKTEEPKTLTALWGDIKAAPGASALDAVNRRRAAMYLQKQIVSMVESTGCARGHALDVLVHEHMTAASQKVLVTALKGMGKSMRAEYLASIEGQGFDAVAIRAEIDAHDFFALGGKEQRALAEQPIVFNPTPEQEEQLHKLLAEGEDYGIVSVSAEGDSLKADIDLHTEPVPGQPVLKGVRWPFGARPLSIPAPKPRSAATVPVVLAEGDEAELYHAGTDSYYDAKILRHVPTKVLQERDTVLYGDVDDVGMHSGIAEVSPLHPRLEAKLNAALQGVRSKAIDWNASATRSPSLEALDSSDFWIENGELTVSFLNEAYAVEGLTVRDLPHALVLESPTDSVRAAIRAIAARHQIMVWPGTPLPGTIDVTAGDPDQVFLQKILAAHGTTSNDRLRTVSIMQRLGQKPEFKPVPIIRFGVAKTGASFEEALAQDQTPTVMHIDLGPLSKEEQKAAEEKVRNLFKAANDPKIENDTSGEHF